MTTLAMRLYSVLFDKFPADAIFRDDGKDRVRVIWTISVSDGTQQNAPYVVAISPVVWTLWETGDGAGQEEIVQRIAQLIDAQWRNYDPVQRSGVPEEFVVAIEADELQPRRVE